MSVSESLDEPTDIKTQNSQVENEENDIEDKDEKILVTRCHEFIVTLTKNISFQFIQNPNELDQIFSNLTKLNV